MRLVKALWVLLVLAVLVFVASNGVKALEAPQAIPQGGMPVGDGVLFVFDIDGRAEHVFAEVDDFGNGYNVWLGGSIPCNQLVVYQSGFGVYHGMAEISGCLVRLSLPNFQVLNEGFGKIGKPQYASGCTGTYGDYGTVVGCAEVMLKLAGYCPEVSNILDQYLCALGASKDLPIESWTVSQAVKDWSLNRPPFDRVALVTRGAVNADQLIKAISCLWVRDITLASDQAVECVGFLLYLDQSPPQPAGLTFTAVSLGYDAGRLSILAPDAVSISAEIYSLDGRRLASFESGGSALRARVNLANGVYLIATRVYALNGALRGGVQKLVVLR